MENTTVENTTVAYAPQEKFIELSKQWREEYGNDIKLEKFFNTENTSTPTMLHKRHIVSSMLSRFLKENNIYPGARNIFTLIYAIDEPEAYAEKCPTFDAEDDEDDNFDYNTCYSDYETDDCSCF